jgi:hypothetical protein
VKIHTHIYIYIYIYTARLLVFDTLAGPVGVAGAGLDCRKSQSQRAPVDHCLRSPVREGSVWHQVQKGVCVGGGE